ncbi:MAG: hypothetical protein KGD67_12355, partial [Candidatus Lokiarchaeota archaeon]|nr:hypothetical protein [Candidatus Lokiarchaeota archaeon]
FKKAFQLLKALELNCEDEKYINSCKEKYCLFFLSTQQDPEIDTLKKDFPEAMESIKSDFLITSLLY